MYLKNASIPYLICFYFTLDPASLFEDNDVYLLTIAD